MSEKSAIKILDCLRRAAPRDLSIEEIANETKIHRNTVSKYLYGLQKEKLVSLTRQVGKAKFYTLRKEA